MVNLCFKIKATKKMMAFMGWDKINRWYETAKTVR